MPWTRRPRPPTARPGSTPRVQQAPRLSSDVPSGTPPTTPPRARPGLPDPGVAWCPAQAGSEDGAPMPEAGLARRTRPSSTEPPWQQRQVTVLGPQPAGRAPCRPWSHVLCPPATDGESRHGAVACPALDPGPVQRCGWLCTPGSGLRCPPSPSRPCRLGKGPPPIPEPLPWPGPAQVLGAGTRNTRSLGSTRGPNHRHQEGLLFEESAGGRKLVRGRAGPSRSEGLKGVMGSRQP